LAEAAGATISIEYCWECSYTLLAVRASQEILMEYEDRIAQLVLIPGADGTFEVNVNGKLVFSKLKTARHAEAGELVAKVGAALSK
jgi:selenoprotein W-related protein